MAARDAGLALVEAVPDQFTELTQFPAIEGKTGSQPALVGGTLLVRNGREMAAFRRPRGQLTKERMSTDDNEATVAESTMM